MTPAEAEAVLEDGCDHPLIVDGQRPLRVGGCCLDCARVANDALTVT